MSRSTRKNGKSAENKRRFFDETEAPADDLPQSEESGWSGLPFVIRRPPPDDRPRMRRRTFAMARR